MQWNLSESEQAAIKQSSLQILERELYSELVLLGIDPEIYESASSVELLNSPEMEIRRTRLQSLTDRILALKAQIGNME